MLTNIFIKSYPVQQFVFITLLIAVYVLGFVLNQPVIQADFSFSFLHFFGLPDYISGVVFPVLASIAIFIIAFIIKLVVGKEKIIPSNSYLLSFILIALTSSFFKHAIINSEFISFIFLALAFSILISFSQVIPKYIRYADLGLLVGLASVFYGPSVFFIFVIYIALSINNLFDWRVWVIPLLFIILTHLLVLTFVVLLTDTTVVAYGQFYFDQLLPRGMNFDSFSNVALGYSIILIIIYFSSLIFLFNGLNKKLILVRKVFMLSFWTSLLFLAFGYFYLNNFAQILLFWSVPVSVLFTNYFTFRKKRVFIRESMFIALIGIGIFYFFF